MLMPKEVMALNGFDIVLNTSVDLLPSGSEEFAINFLKAIIVLIENACDPLSIIGKEDLDEYLLEIVLEHPSSTASEIARVIHEKYTKEQQSFE